MGDLHAMLLAGCHAGLTRRAHALGREPTGRAGIDWSLQDIGSPAKTP
ncbi:hypothetical protein Hsc_3165 [Herbaspirillum seropedicae]|nr:hypothetical protein Hsc_3165 [Herbaspirillum seropedicae]